MLKQIMIGLVTVVALTAYAPTDAMARGGGFGGGGGFHGGGGGGFHGGGGGGFRGGGFQGGGFRGAAVQGGGFRGVGSFAMGGARFAAIRGTGFHGNFGHGRHFRRFAPFVVGFGLPYYYNNYYDDLYYANYGYDGCFRVIRVHTRYGWRWRQVNICG